jgi:hypothetical protein
VEFYALLSSSNTILVIKSRGMRWVGVGHVVRIWTGEVHTGFWWGDPRECDHLEDLGVDWRILLKRICNQWDGEAWTGLLWLRKRRGVEHL